MGIEGAHHFQACHHAVVAIELATRGLGVNMAARGHGAGLWVGACATAKYIANGIDAHFQTCILEPLHDQIAAAPVFIGQGDAADAAFGGGANLAQVHQRLPQAFAINAQVFNGGVHDAAPV